MVMHGGRTKSDVSVTCVWVDLRSNVVTWSCRFRSSVVVVFTVTSVHLLSDKQLSFVF